MLEIETAAFPSPKQWKLVIHGMRNPMNSWDKGDSFICKGEEESGTEAIEKECKWCPYSMWYLGDNLDELFSKNDKEFHGCGGLGYLWEGFFRFGEKDKDLAKRLISSGSEHRKFLQQLPIIVDIKAPLYFWKQFDTYRLGVTKNSCSTMHKLTEREFTQEDFSTEGVDSFNIIDDFAWGDIIPSLDVVISNLNEFRDKYLEENDKRYWSAINELLPQSYNQLRTVSLNYETLFNICKQRAGHKLKEWSTFIKWAIDEVPYFEELCFEKLCAESVAFDRMFNGSNEKTEEVS